MVKTLPRTSASLLVGALVAALIAGCFVEPQSPTLPPPTSAAPTATTTALVTPGPSPSSALPSPTSGVIPPLGTATPPASPGTPGPGSPLPTSSIPVDTPLPTPLGTPSGPGLAGELAARLQQVLEGQRTSIDIPGMTATVVFPDRSEWEGATGFADVDAGQQATTETTFSAGSITKTFVATTMMQLAEEGVLSLDDPLSNWLPDYPRAGEITLRHLLGHTSGVFNYFEDQTYNGQVFGGNPDHDWTPQEILDDFDGPPYFVPGAGYHYSNTGFILLGLVIEAATGESLGDNFRDRFFGPLNLDHTYFQADGPPPPGSALGYLDKTDGFKAIADGTDYRPTKSGATVAWAAGAIVSTAHDLATWVRTVYGGHLLAADSLAQMTDYNYSTYSLQTYGLGTRTRLFGTYRMFGHTGSLRGFYAAMWHIPDLNLSIVVMTNRGRFDPNRIIDALAEVAIPALNP